MDEGEYVKVGDAWEWHWNTGHEPKVEAPDFDPREPKAEKAKAQTAKTETAKTEKVDKG